MNHSILGLDFSKNTLHHVKLNSNDSVIVRENHKNALGV